MLHEKCEFFFLTVLEINLNSSYYLYTDKPAMDLFWKKYIILIFAAIYISMDIPWTCYKVSYIHVKFYYFSKKSVSYNIWFQATTQAHMEYWVRILHIRM